MKPLSPCPYCQLPYMVRYRAVRGVEEGSIIKIRDIQDHDCPSFREEEPLAAGDPDFRVIPARDADDMAYSMQRYRRSLR